mmetsp:Transcript_49005/g.138467  ORF Transcript_49005/g.138467 Transcript_49005/m.138467 type:complete len:345 (+) Transcript_49005:282-1316(+)
MSRRLHLHQEVARAPQVARGDAGLDHEAVGLLQHVDVGARQLLMQVVRDIGALDLERRIQNAPQHHLRLLVGLSRLCRVHLEGFRRRQRGRRRRRRRRPQDVQAGSRAQRGLFRLAGAAAGLDRRGADASQRAGLRRSAHEVVPGLRHLRRLGSGHRAAHVHQAPRQWRHAHLGLRELGESTGSGDRAGPGHGGEARRVQHGLRGGEGRRQRRQRRGHTGEGENPGRVGELPARPAGHHVHRLRHQLHRGRHGPPRAAVPVRAGRHREPRPEPQRRDGLRRHRRPRGRDRRKVRRHQEHDLRCPRLRQCRRDGRARARRRRREGLRLRQGLRPRRGRRRRHQRV